MSIRKSGVTFDGAQVNYQQQQQAQQQKYFQEQQAAQQHMFEQQRQTQEKFYAEQKAQQQRSETERRAGDQRMAEQKRQQDAQIAQQRATDERRAQETKQSEDRAASEKRQKTQNTTPPPPPINNSGGGGGRMSPNDYLPGRLSSQFDYRSEGNPSYQKRPDDNLNLAWEAQIEVIPFNGGYIEVKSGYEGVTRSTFLQKNNGSFEKIDHTTGHTAGNYHIHPNEQDKSKSYFGNKPNRWYGKDGLLSQIVDKGPKK